MRRSRPRGGRKKNASRTERVVARDGTACWICGLPTDPETRSLDHVVPRARGGTGALSNLRLAHKLCNSIRGQADPEVAAALVRAGLERLAARGRRLGRSASRALRRRVRAAQALAEAGPAETGGPRTLVLTTGEEVWVLPDEADRAG